MLSKLQSKPLNGVTNNAMAILERTAGVVPSSNMIRCYHQTKNNKTILLTPRTSSDYVTMTLNALKQECRKRGIKVSGRKIELVNRLVKQDRDSNSKLSVGAAMASVDKVGGSTTAQGLHYIIDNGNKNGSSEIIKKNTLKMKNNNNNIPNERFISSSVQPQIKADQPQNLEQQSNRLQHSVGFKGTMDRKTGSTTESYSTLNILRELDASNNVDHVKFPDLLALNRVKVSESPISMLLLKTPSIGHQPEEKIVVMDDSQPISSSSPIVNGSNIDITPSSLSATTDSGKTSLTITPSNEEIQPLQLMMAEITSTPFFRNIKRIITEFANSEVVADGEKYQLEPVNLTKNEVNFFQWFVVGVVGYWVGSELIEKKRGSKVIS
ncbi:hypothetical protein DASC09_061800 [Saccharomycopsis crataegensis]|uniref:SAP domain-containing protein n=1 Tax=Saccharomycopsis crataegensis TaxID=43959 RepID=A0AAV5QWL1_9ASCO|nr:hypothetical protein DASC09_061800 [Saccharomycopsis crataegensis]